MAKLLEREMAMEREREREIQRESCFYSRFIIKGRLSHSKFHLFCVCASRLFFAAFRAKNVAIALHSQEVY